MSRNRAALDRARRTGVSYQAALTAIRSTDPVPSGAAVVIACASRKGGEGKTVITANLAAALAQNGSRVLAVDCDSQRHLQRYFQRFLAPLQRSHSKLWTPIEGPQGSGQLAVSEAPVEGSDSRSEIRRLRDVLRAAHTRFDLILLDSPPGHLADLVANHADALLVPIHELSRVWAERIPDSHEPMFDWLDSAFDDWLDEHEEDAPDEDTLEGDQWYQAQRAGFLTSIDAVAAGKWPASWPHQIPAWIQRDEQPSTAGRYATRPLTPEEVLDEIGQRVPIDRSLLRSAGAGHTRPRLLGLVQNLVELSDSHNPVDEVRAFLTTNGVPVFRTWIGRSTALDGLEPLVLGEHQESATQQFHQLAAELRQCLSTWRP